MFCICLARRAGSISVRLGHGHARFTSNIRLRSSFAGPGEPLALNLKPYVGHPALAAIRAVRNHVPAALGLLFLLERQNVSPARAPSASIIVGSKRFVFVVEHAL